MDKNDLIAKCRYYRGESECPYDGTMEWFWDMERVYVSSGGRFNGEGDYYNALRGKEYPGIPRDLLNVMFTSWGKSTYNVKEELPGFYKLIDEYQAIANDHYPEDKIPPEGMPLP